MKQMKNPKETNGYVMLYTMQDKRSLDVLKKRKKIHQQIGIRKRTFGRHI